MAVRATLRAPGNRDYRVLKFDYEFTQPVDSNYVPVAVPRGGIINIVIEAVNDTSILAWMLATDSPSTGFITVTDGEASTLRNINFQGGHCIYYREDYDAFSEDPMKIHFRVACQSIDINDMVHRQITWTEEGSSIEPASGSSSSGSSASPSTSSASGSSSEAGVSSFNPND